MDGSKTLLFRFFQTTTLPLATFWPLLCYYAIATGLVYAVQSDPFFWDTVQLGSKHAHFFYENGLQWSPLPSAIDSGHPPVFGYYLAVVWQVFGKTIPISHWAMLPFLLLNGSLLYLIGRHIGGDQWAWWLLPVALLDPVLAGQSILMSPDVVLVSGFLLALWGILGQKRLIITIGVVMLCAVSMRGMMTAGALFLWSLYVGFSRSGYPNGRLALFAAFRTNLPLFLPGYAFAGWFLWWHWQAAGWIGFHAGSAWAPAFAPAQGNDLLKNVLIVGWRWLDFGRIVEWLIFLYVIIKFKKKIITEENSKALLIFWLLLLLLLLPAPLRYHNLSAHRYFLPGFLAFHLLVFRGIIQLKLSDFQRMYILTGLVAGLAGGNFWIYPQGISMDWDSTLAQQAYPAQRAAAVDYLDRQHIDFETVGSAFPNLNTGENLLLNGDSRHFSDLDFARNQFIFASNVFNDISEEDFKLLQSDWDLRYRSEHGGVWVEIYERK